MSKLSDKWKPKPKPIPKKIKKLAEIVEETVYEIQEPETPQIEVLRIPAEIIQLNNLERLSIARLRDIYSRIFGVEPKHDREHNKEWIAKSIRNSFNKKTQ